MALRKFSPLAALLALTACSCTPQHAKPEQGSKPIDTRTRHGSLGPNTTAAGAQVTRLKYDRNGAWTPIRTMPDRNGVVGVVMLARDRFGDRLAAVRQGQGYDVYRIRLDCDHGLYSVYRGMTSQRDDKLPTGTAEPHQVPIDRTEIKRACALPATDGPMPLLSAISTLRRADAASKAPPRLAAGGPAAHAQVAGGPKEPSAEERARMYQEYLAKNHLK